MGAGSERTLEIIWEYFAVDRTYFVLCQNCVFAIKLGDAGASKKTMDQKTQENQNHMVGPGGRGGDWTRKTTTSRIVLILRRWCFILKTSFLIQTGLMLVPEPTHFNTLKGSIQIPTNLCVCVCVSGGKGSSILQASVAQGYSWHVWTANGAALHDLHPKAVLGHAMALQERDIWLHIFQEFFALPVPQRQVILLLFLVRWFTVKPSMRPNLYTT